jgi:regulator of protease activity HflC (stomatin/prohibitin superfamily)
MSPAAAPPAAPADAWWFALLHRIGRGILRSFRQHPEWWIPALIAFIRSFGVTVRTGERGVKFFCGRVTGELDAGFHWLAPGLHHVRKIHVRSSTMDLAAQRVALPDGLVYLVDMNVVYSVADATAALVNVDDLPAAVRNVLPIAVQETLWECRRADLREQDRLDAALHEAVQSRVARWGVEVEKAGFMSISPSPQTLRITQLAPRVRENRLQLEALRAGGLAGATTLGLLGARRRLVAKEVARRRSGLRRVGKAQPRKRGRPIPVVVLAAPVNRPTMSG